ncbi:hypothetical protein PIROE2DRAFT_1107, partial [Piromyces sp. E2]
MLNSLFKNSVKKTLTFITTYLVLVNNINAYSYSKDDTDVTDVELNNPYIGWFHGATTIDLNDYPNYDCNYISTFTNVKNLKSGLQYLGVRLAEFRDKEISDVALTALRNLLEEYRKHKKVDPTLQIILRFYYDGSNNYKADSSFKPIKIKKVSRKRSYSASDSNDNEYGEFKQVDNGELYLTYDDYKYFKEEYDPNILDEINKSSNSGITNIGVEEDQGNVTEKKKEEIPKIEYYDSNGKLQTIELNDENDTLEDLKITKKDRQKLKNNAKYNNERYFNEHNKLSLNNKEMKDYENNAIFINDNIINNIINNHHEKRGNRQYNSEFYKNATKSQYENTRPIAKELYIKSLDDNYMMKKKYTVIAGNDHKETSEYYFAKYETPEIEPDLNTTIYHIIQLSDIVNEYKDLIYIYQGAFVGTYGEMHSSEHLKIDELSLIIHALNELIDPSIFLSVRTPAFYRGLKDTFYANKNSYYNFDYSLFEKRMSLYNDGLFYNDDDYGTYKSKKVSDENKLDKNNYLKKYREKEVSFQNSLCLNVPNGGEAVYFNKTKAIQSNEYVTNESELYNLFEKADEHARNIHLSYLNDQHDIKLLNLWEKTITSKISKRYPNWNVN